MSPGRARCWRQAQAGAIALLVLVLGYRVAFVHPFRRALPWSAELVSERAWNEPGPLSQDFSYELEARMSEAAFLAYMRRLELVPYAPAATQRSQGRRLAHEVLPSSGDYGWWERPGAFERVYGSQSGSSCYVFARYAEGRVWVVAGCL